MKERVEKVLAELAASRADYRLHRFDVQAEADSAQTIRLSGRILESADLQAILAKLDGVNVDASGVEVLRRQPATMRYVATNLTNLHREPSWISELMTQFTNGEALEILEEKDRWCFVRTEQGYLGWTYKSYLSEQPPATTSHIVCVPMAKVVKESQIVTRIPGGTLVTAEVDGGWAKVWRGMVEAKALRALPLKESAQRMIADAEQFIGTYYVWGGRSAWGVDCSGLCQLVHKLSGYTIPRDADMQFAAGKIVEPPYQPGDLMFFGGEPAAHAPRKITHVALSLGGWKIIHSSRSNNGVYEDDIQTVEHLRTSFCGARTFIR